MAEAKMDKNFIPSTLGVTDDTNLTPQPFRVDPTSKRLKVDSNSADGSSSIGTGRTALAAAGTAQQLAYTSTACSRVWVESSKANSSLTNKGLVVIGDANVVAAEATRRGLLLFPTQGQWLNVNNLNLIYWDSTDTAAVVHFYYEV